MNGEGGQTEADVPRAHFIFLLTEESQALDRAKQLNIPLLFQGALKFQIQADKIWRKHFQTQPFAIAN